MNVASLELSKELYELSGWDDTSSHFYYDKRTYTPGNKPVSEGFELTAGAFEDALNQFIDPEMQEAYPAYDLGYLLRKLPENITIGRRADGWVVGTYKINVYVKSAKGDSPEDAAANLAIELFKQGVLTRGGDE